MIKSDTFRNSRTEIIEALKTVIDPELQLNIVDLGLVYAIEPDGNQGAIRVDMTLSSRSCPMGESILSATRHCLERSFEPFKAEVNLVWDPEWNADFISPAGIRTLRGF